MKALLLFGAVTFLVFFSFFDTTPLEEEFPADEHFWI